MVRQNIHGITIKLVISLPKFAPKSKLLATSRLPEVILQKVGQHFAEAMCGVLG